jgi:hypothetical protein
VKALKVRGIPGSVEREDLAFALLGDFVAASKAFNENAALGRAVTLMNDVLIRTNLLHRQRQVPQALLLVSGERADAPQLAHESIVLLKFDRQRNAPEDELASANRLSRGR